MFVLQLMYSICCATEAPKNHHLPQVIPSIENFDIRHHIMIYATPTPVFLGLCDSVTIRFLYILHLYGLGPYPALGARAPSLFDCCCADAALLHPAAATGYSIIFAVCPVTLFVS
ncbi:hypothetical protein BDR05DRAFT_641806 [Suillus weaverae]|nr:hypothetical protein BDR05DRAFT_641806 [Suillus weaverae]